MSGNHRYGGSRKNSVSSNNNQITLYQEDEDEIPSHMNSSLADVASSEAAKNYVSVRSSRPPLKRNSKNFNSHEKTKTPKV
jgi:hypothetical protein